MKTFPAAITFIFMYNLISDYKIHLDLHHHSTETVEDERGTTATTCRIYKLLVLKHNLRTISIEDTTLSSSS